MRYDVAVIGGGPGGSIAAYVAAKLGLRVLLIDRFRFPRVKPCGGGLTPKALSLLAALNIDVGPMVRSSCDKVLLLHLSGNYLLRGANLITVTSREEFDGYLLNMALEAGVEYVVDTVVGIRRGNGLEVLGRGGTYEALHVIGADGANSVVSRQLNGDWGDRAIAYMTIAKGNLPEDLCIVDLTAIRWGYAWSFPRGRGEHDVGLGSILWGNYTDMLINYTRALGLEPSNVLGHPIPIKAKGRLAHGGIFLVGDAGGFADPATGEGIFYAMYTGALASLSIGKSLNPRDRVRVYLGSVSPLVRNLGISRKLAYVAYGVDALVMGRLGLSFLGLREGLEALAKVLGGRLWYGQLLKLGLRYSIAKAPREALRKVLQGRG